MERHSKNVSQNKIQNEGGGGCGGRKAMDLICNALDSKPWYLGWGKVYECRTAALMLKGIESSLPFPVSKKRPKKIKSELYWTYQTRSTVKHKRMVSERQQGLACHNSRWLIEKGRGRAWGIETLAFNVSHVSLFITEWCWKKAFGPFSFPLQIIPS